ncbi:hypothetical protein LX36DRAFT_140437 [Colletotrichum falcatum]|nr:hypothetical protein LX36DRAFT_140437 [Colletotrichum falcatum]
MPTRIHGRYLGRYLPTDMSSIHSLIHSFIRPPSLCLRVARSPPAAIQTRQVHNPHQREAIWCSMPACLPIPWCVTTNANQYRIIRRRAGIWHWHSHSRPPFPYHHPFPTNAIHQEPNAFFILLPTLFGHSSALVHLLSPLMAHVLPSLHRNLAVASLLTLSPTYLVGRLAHVHPVQPPLFSHRSVPHGVATWIETTGSCARWAGKEKTHGENRTSDDPESLSSVLARVG